MCVCTSTDRCVYDNSTHLILAHITVAHISARLYDNSVCDNFCCYVCYCHDWCVYNNMCIPTTCVEQHVSYTAHVYDMCALVVHKSDMKSAHMSGAIVINMTICMTICMTMYHVRHQHVYNNNMCRTTRVIHCTRVWHVCSCRTHIGYDNSTQVFCYCHMYDNMYDNVLQASSVWQDTAHAAHTERVICMTICIWGGYD